MDRRRSNIRRVSLTKTFPTWYILLNAIGIYYFAWGLDELALKDLVELVHVRWVVERFYQDAKGELGLDDYEGRLWPGFHRHVALVMLAHCYLTLQQTYGPALPKANPGAPARGFPPQGAQ